MAQSLSQIYLHVVFSTKHRVPSLADRALREQTFAYFVGACDSLGSPSVRVGGVEDHVHILCRLSKTLCAADLVRDLKRETSKWLKEQSADLGEFHWQAGYGAFSISPGHIDRLIDYIDRQEEHHKGETFQTEFRRLLTIYRIDYDERYVWD